MRYRHVCACLAGVWVGVAVADDSIPPDAHVFRVDLAYGGHWCDAEKTRATRADDLACWAAPAANVLAWTGWGNAAGFEDEDRIFAHLVGGLVKHRADSPRTAWEWWFGGGQPGGGLIKDTPFPDYTWESPRGALYRGLGCKMIERRPLSLKQLLDEGYGVVIQVITPLPGGGRDSHMITLWGYTYTDEQPFTGIIVSDSDDAKDNRDPRRAPNELVYRAVTMRDGMWWFNDGRRDRQILAAYALARRAAQVPSTWRFTTTAPGRGWQQPGFDDSSWREGPAGFGTAGTRRLNVRTEWATEQIWMRRQIELSAQPKAANIRLFHDDDCEVYINGQLAVQRSGFVRRYVLVSIEEPGILRRGKNTIAVYCRQTLGKQGIDVELLPITSDDARSRK